MSGSGKSALKSGRKGEREGSAAGTTSSHSSVYSTPRKVLEPEAISPARRALAYAPATGPEPLASLDLDSENLDPGKTPKDGAETKAQAQAGAGTGKESKAQAREGETRDENAENIAPGGAAGMVSGSGHAHERVRDAWGPPGGEKKDLLNGLESAVDETPKGSGKGRGRGGRGARGKEGGERDGEAEEEDDDDDWDPTELTLSCTPLRGKKHGSTQRKGMSPFVKHTVSLHNCLLSLLSEEVLYRGPQLSRRAFQR